MPHNYHHNHRHKRKQPEDDTPLSTRIWMVFISFAILGTLYFFFGENRFPKEIVYRNVPMIGSTYVIQKEQVR